LTANRFLHALIALLLVAWIGPVAAAPAQVTLLTVDGAIGPASADYLVRGIARAAKDGSQLVIVQMDTPGGLDTSMRAIIKAILTSPVPVAGYVAPSGARAASAGTYILYASHIAAMAPGTNLGAATPVQIGGNPMQPEPEKPAPGSNGDATGKKPEEATGKADGGSAMTRKQVNDAAAYIRGLAQMRGRNIDWAERAVREAVSLPAQDALQFGVVEYIAADVAALIKQLDGKKVNVLGQEKLLQTRNAIVNDVQPDWRAQLLAVITNPSVALLLMTIGIYGIIFEFTNPGLALPGVVGAICLLLAMYALQLLPVNYAGLALILLGMAFMVAEAFVPSFGVLGLGGIAAFVTGALILIDTELPGFGIPLAVIAAVAVVSALLLAGMVGIALKTRRRAVVVGPGDLIGSIAEMQESTQREGWALLRGETWRVVSNTPLQRAQKVRVVARNGLVLEVVPAGNNEKGE
jgi:membrane-bound serine protease (ClpP class)